MQKTAHKSFEQPEERRESSNGEAQIVVVGDESVVVVDWYGASNYARAS